MFGQPGRLGAGTLNRDQATGDISDTLSIEQAEAKMTTRRTLMFAIVLSAFGHAGSALAQVCHREGSAVACDDGRRGELSGDAIIWSDGTRSSSSPHPSVIIGNKSSVIVGPGVFVGQGKGVVPMENPSAQTRCPVLDSVSYCY
jgi:hypothetical protein